MDQLRADILNTGEERLKSAQIKISAPANEVFEVLVQPRLHSAIDGSNSVKGVFSGPERLSLGARFGMKMRIGISYRVTNTVTEFKAGELIAWRHLGRWVWRYELRALSPTETLVTESFDGRPSPFQWWLRKRKAYPYVEKALAKSLVKLKRFVEERS